MLALGDVHGVANHSGHRTVLVFKQRQGKVSKEVLPGLSPLAHLHFMLTLFLERFDHLLLKEFVRIFRVDKRDMFAQRLLRGVSE